MRTDTCHVAPEHPWVAGLREDLKELIQKHLEAHGEFDLEELQAWLSQQLQKAAAELHRERALHMDDEGFIRERRMP